MEDDRFVLRTRILVEVAGDDSMILIDGHSGNMWSSNATAKALLTRLQSGATGGELIEALTAAFDVAISVASRDVERFLETLSAMDLLEVAGSSQTISEPFAIAVA